MAFPGEKLSKRKEGGRRFLKNSYRDQPAVLAGWLLPH